MTTTPMGTTPIMTTKITRTLFFAGCLSLSAVLFSGCGLAESDRDLDNKHIYINIPDAQFKAYCIKEFDLDGDKQVSRYEAQRALYIDCSSLGIGSMIGIEEFINLRTLNCSANQITILSLKACRALQKLDCSGNQISLLDIEGLRSLYEVRCNNNLITTLSLGSNTALTTLVCGKNLLTTLDIRRCALTFNELDTLNNPDLSVIYKSPSQRIVSQSIDGHTSIIEQS